MTIERTREFNIGVGTLTEAEARSSSRFYRKLVRGDYIVNAAALPCSGSTRPPQSMNGLGWIRGVASDYSKIFCGGCILLLRTEMNLVFCECEKLVFGEIERSL